jgi:OOP family OmpA-OmpF porin
MLKQTLTTVVLGASALSILAAQAAAPGPYVTGQFGYSSTRLQVNETTLDTNLDKIKFAKDRSFGILGRGAIGYQFDQNWAAEIGYDWMASKKFNATDDKSGNWVKLNQSVIDIAGKGIYPLGNNFNVYGKLGVAYLTTRVKAQNWLPIGSTVNVKEHVFAPEAAVGVSYDITQNVSVDTSFNHIQTIGKNRPGNIDFMTVGVGYNFG